MEKPKAQQTKMAHAAKSGSRFPAPGAGPPAPVYKLGSMTDAEIMALAQRHNKKLGLEGDVLAPVMRGVVDMATYRPPAVHPFTVGAAHRKDENSAAWKSLAKYIGVPLLPLSDTLSPPPGGPSGPSAVTIGRATEPAPAAAAASATMPVPPPTQVQMYGSEQPQLQVQFADTLAAWLGLGPIDLPLLAPGVPPLSLRRLFMEVHEAVHGGRRRGTSAAAGATAANSAAASWPTLSHKILGTEELGPLLKQVYDAYLRPLEQRMAPGTRPARADAWMQEELRRRGGLMAEGVAATTPQVLARLKVALAAVLKYDPTARAPQQPQLPPTLPPPPSRAPSPPPSHRRLSQHTHGESQPHGDGASVKEAPAAPTAGAAEPVQPSSATGPAPADGAAPAGGAGAGAGEAAGAADMIVDSTSEAAAAEPASAAATADPAGADPAGAAGSNPMDTSNGASMATAQAAGAAARTGGEASVAAASAAAGAPDGGATGATHAAAPRAPGSGAGGKEPGPSNPHPTSSLPLQILRELRRVALTPCTLLPAAPTAPGSKRPRSVGRGGRRLSAGKKRPRATDGGGGPGSEGGDEGMRPASQAAAPAAAEVSDPRVAGADDVSGELGMLGRDLVDAKAASLLSVVTCLRELRAGPPGCGLPLPDLRTNFLQRWEEDYVAKAAAVAAAIAAAAAAASIPAGAGPYALSEAEVVPPAEGGNTDAVMADGGGSGAGAVRGPEPVDPGSEGEKAAAGVQRAQQADGVPAVPPPGPSDSQAGEQRPAGVASPSDEARVEEERKPAAAREDPSAEAGETAPSPSGAKSAQPTADAPPGVPREEVGAGPKTDKGAKQAGQPKRDSDARAPHGPDSPSRSTPRGFKPQPQAEAERERDRERGRDMTWPGDRGRDRSRERERFPAPQQQHRGTTRHVTPPNHTNPRPQPRFPALASVAPSLPPPFHPRGPSPPGDYHRHPHPQAQPPQPPSGQQQLMRRTGQGPPPYGDGGGGGGNRGDYAYGGPSPPQASERGRYTDRASHEGDGYGPGRPGQGHYGSLPPHGQRRPYPQQRFQARGGPGWE